MRLDYGLVGAWLLIGSVVAIAIEAGVAAVWGVRLARRGKALQARLQDERGRLQSDVERLRLALAETQVLWQPYARLVRWLRHPLAIALLASFRGRMGAR